MPRNVRRRADGVTYFDDHRGLGVELAPAIKRRAKKAAKLLEEIVGDSVGDMSGCEAKYLELGCAVGCGPYRRPTDEEAHSMETWYATTFYIDCRRDDILEQAAAEAERFGASMCKAAKLLRAEAKRRRSGAR